MTARAHVLYIWIEGALDDGVLVAIREGVLQLLADEEAAMDEELGSGVYDHRSVKSYPCSLLHICYFICREMCVV